MCVIGRQREAVGDRRRRLNGRKETGRSIMLITTRSARSNGQDGSDYVEQRGTEFFFRMQLLGSGELVLLRGSCVKH